LIAVAKAHDRPPVGATSRAWTSLEAALGAGMGPSVPVTAAASASTTAGGLGFKGLVVVGVAVLMAGGAAIVLGSKERGATEAARADATPVHRRGASDATTPALGGATQTDAPPSHPQATIEGATIEPPVPTPERDAIAAAPAAAAPERDVRRRRRADVRADGRRDTPPPADAKPDPPQSDLAEQARLVGEAWRAVNAGNAARALELVAEHARRFPRSPLAPERDACRIVAWCEQGRPWAAAKARAFLAAHGGTPASRVQQACGGPEQKE
jgi:hypothetical protein